MLCEHAMPAVLIKKYGVQKKDFCHLIQSESKTPSQSVSFRTVQRDMSTYQEVAW